MKRIMLLRVLQEKVCIGLSNVCTIYEGVVQQHRNYIDSEFSGYLSLKSGNDNSRLSVLVINLWRLYCTQ